MSESVAQEEPKSRWSVIKIAIIAVGALIAVILLIFIIAVVIAFQNSENAARFVGAVRDFLIITVTLETILILLAFAVLVVQLARTTNLVQTEVKPILQDTADAAKTAKGTAQFVSKNVSAPIIRVLGFFTTVSVFVREFGGLRRAVRRTKKGE